MNIDEMFENRAASKKWELIQTSNFLDSSLRTTSKKI